ncbi:hypothetical protein B0H14DRAFT_1091399 [Mycena olivaceomarginata]|nr:hypothetical protein B0H14DRAFT_1091399 [Mycena olivaceomarginata]
MKVEELPQDVLLEIAQRLNLRDLLAFLSTCHGIRQLRFQRSLWLGALVRLKEIELQPLPLSTATPLETLSLPELQSIARRADRLKRNWQSNNSRLVHLSRFSIPSQAEIVFVPGAHLAVAYGLHIISCWDILSSQRVAHLEIPGLILLPEALCMDINGKALIGAFIRWFPRNLAVICIDFRDPQLASSSTRAVRDSSMVPNLSSGAWIQMSQYKLRHSNELIGRNACY